jgi:hypothetical protein
MSADLPSGSSPLAARGGVVALDAGAQRGRVGLHARRPSPRRLPLLRAKEHQRQRRQGLEGPQAAEQAFRIACRRSARIQHQPGAATLLLDHGVAQRGAVDLLVAEALAAGVDDDALGPGCTGA